MCVGVCVCVSMRVWFAGSTSEMSGYESLYEFEYMSCPVSSQMMCSILTCVHVIFLHFCIVFSFLQSVLKCALGIFNFVKAFVHIVSQTYSLFIIPQLSDGK